ncbi:MAG: glycosyltransferase family 2 protein [Ruminococcus sp.]|nr:glycosyltransferase family 2 protein [Ruminococcus sp.]
MYKISVIVPVYNVEKYLSKTIETVINQTYTNIEVILVDDGSTDNSLKICYEYAEKDNRIRVIHQYNQGLSVARNVGTELATGEYIFYLDGDDYLNQNALEVLISHSKECDLVIGNYYYTYSDREDVARNDYSEKSVLNTKDAMHDLLIGKIQNFAWGKLIKTSIAKKYKFPPGKLFEDTYWAHLVINDCDKILITNIPVMHYRQRDNSISYTIDIKRLDVLEGWSNRAEFVKKNYPQFYAEYMQFVVSSLLSFAWLVFTRMKNEKQVAYSMLREFSKKYKLMDFSKTALDKDLIMALNKGNKQYEIKALVNKIICKLKG